MKSNRIKGIRNVLFVFISLVLFSKGFSFVFWEETIGKNLTILLAIVNIILYIIRLSIMMTERDVLNRIALIMPMLLVGSMITRYFYLGDHLNDYNSTLLLGAMCSYSWFRLLRISTSEIIISFCIFCSISFVLQIYQQYFTNMILFGMNEDAIKSVEEWGFNLRNGLKRFNIGSPIICVFLISYYWNSMIEKFKYYKIVFFFTFCFSLYLYLTRQFIFAVPVAIIISMFLQNKKYMAKKSAIFVIFLVGLGIYFYDVIFASLVEQSKEDTYSTDIRWECIAFFINKCFEDPITIITGHSLYIGMDIWKDRYGYYASDIGFIGQIYVRGLVYVILYFVVIKTVIFKYRKQLPPYLVLFTIATSIYSLFYFPYASWCNCFVWMLFLYLININLEHSKYKPTLNSMIM